APLFRPRPPPRSTLFPYTTLFRSADLGIWLDEAPLTWTVPTYLEDINSIADLQGNGDLFGGQVVGIEPSAGLTRISRDEVIPTRSEERRVGKEGRARRSP